MPTITDQPPEALMQNLLSILCWSDQHGALVAQLLDPQLFEGDFRDIAIRATNYWQQHGTAPKIHLVDLMAAELQTDNRRSTNMRRIIFGTHRLLEEINTDFVLQSLNQFLRQQLARQNVLKSADLLTQGGHIEQVEEVWSDYLRTRSSTAFDPGVALGDDLDEFFAQLAANEADEFSTGIAELDRNHAVPARDTVMILMGVTGQGKSWWLVHLGQHALRQHKKVLYVTLEMPVWKVRRRFFQNLLAIPKDQRFLQSTCTKLIVRDGRLLNLQKQAVEADFSLASADAKQRVKKFLAQGAQFRNLRFKYFPMHKLSVAQLRGYLTVLDHARLMDIDIRNFRLAFGHLLEELHDLAIQY